MQLTDIFFTVVEPVKMGTSNSSRNGKSKSRRISKTGSEPSSTSHNDIDDSHTNRPDGSEGSTDVPQQKRIRLQKSRRIATERSV
jgi:hypothetical protein